MDVDGYQLASSIFYRNWQRFGIPEEDIPLVDIEAADPLNDIIPGFSKAVLIFQIASRSDLKTLLDQSPRVHSLIEFRSCFEKIMKEVFPGRFVIIQEPTKDRKKENRPNVAIKDQSVDTMETDISDPVEDLSDDSKKESLLKDSSAEVVSKDNKKESHSMKEEISEGKMDTDLSEVATEDDMSEDSNKEDLPRNSKKALSKDTKKEVITKEGKKESLTKEGKKESLSKEGKKESLSKEGKKESLSKEGKKESLSKESKNEYKKETHSEKEDISEDTMETDLSENTTEEDLSELSRKESPSEDNKITAEEVPQVIAFSLAICPDLILYQYEDTENDMQYLPDMWLEFFDENLKNLCDEVGCTSEMLRAYGESIRCADSYFDEFVSENKNEYQDIEQKFTNFGKTNYASESPVSERFDIEVRCFPAGLCFARMKAQFKAIVESCRCMKVKAADEEPCSTITAY